MSDYLERACNQLGIDPGSVIKHREDGDELVIIADLGIRGTPKYRVPLSSLAEPEPEPEPVEEPGALETQPELDEPVPLSDYDYRELQTMAKDLGVAANQSAGDLRAELGFLLGKEEEE